MTVNGTPETALEAPAIASDAGTTSDTGSADETNDGASQRATLVAAGRKKKGTPPVAERPPHPGSLTWVDCTEEVCAMARGGMSVAEIARASGISRSQVETALSVGGVRRPQAAPLRVGPRKFDRAAVRAAHAAGDSRAWIAARMGISLSSVSLAINEVIP